MADGRWQTSWDGQDLVLAWPHWKLTARLSRLHERPDGLHGELALHHERAGQIFWGTVNLSSAWVRGRIASKLRQDIPPGDGVPNWTRVVDSLAWEATAAFRAAGATVLVGTPDDIPEETSYLLPPLLMRGELNLVFGPPGVGKSYLAAALALQVEGVSVLPLPLPRPPGRTLYLDWEWSGAELGVRLQALCRGAGTPAHPIRYRRMAGALADCAETLRREIQQGKITFVIVDSVQMACGEPDGADPAGGFLRLAGAIRTFGTTTLLLDHPAKGAEPGRETPYGTRYKLALCRNIWSMRKSHDDQRQLHIGLWHDKNSNTPPHPPLGLRLEFDRESWPAGRLRSLRVHHEDVRDVEEFASMLGTWDRIARELIRGPMTVRELAEALDLSDGVVRARLNEKRRAGKVTHLPDGRWGLLDQREETP
ncbi:MAG: AAA family ATPase [Armatimonadota bacterium]|nr:AAA family ATPase [Armatimonadota bacterium]MDR7574355.1 AAA family ATPase [Armatimonadota bacterium]